MTFKARVDNYNGIEVYTKAEIDALLAGKVPPPPTPPPTGATLLWSDEFNGTALDTTKWAYENGGGGLYGDDITYYQAPNVAVSNGNLVITATHDGSTYHSGRIGSKFTVDQGCYVEARISIPYGKGFWPAFWMLSRGAGNYTEWDILESINAEHIAYSTFWVGTSSSYTSAVNKGGGQTPVTGGFHVYGFEWTPQGLACYVDGVKFASLPISIRRTMYIILNLAIGGSWAGSPDSSSPFPASMLVDYVRVWNSKPS